MHGLPPMFQLPFVAANLLLASIWQGVLLTAVVALCLRLAGRLSPATRSAIWTGVLLLLLCLPVLPLLLVRGPGAHRAAGVVHVQSGWGWALLAVWALASIARGVRLGLRALRLWGVARRAEAVRPAPAVRRLLESPRRTLLCTSNEVDRPSVAGFFRPRILLPPDLLLSLTEVELAQVVLHEMEHLRRGDDWLNLLQQVGLVLLPLHPAMLWLDRRLCQERELACDDGVLQQTHARKAYAACLVKLAEDSMLRRGVSLALSALGTRARESELVARVGRILTDAERGASARPSGLVTGSVVSLSLAVAIGMAGVAPQLVSFDQRSPALVEAAQVPLRAPQANAFGPYREVRTLATLPGELSEAKADMSAKFTAGDAAVPPALANAAMRKGNMSPHRSLAAAVSSRGATGSTAGLRRNVPVVREIMLPVERAVPAAAERVVLTGFEVPQSVYAAVPWQGGWLIVQL